MSGFARREQLVAVGRSLFAEKGFGATSVEEIAARAKVSKPVVYEHFGGKEGLYAVIVDREVQALISSLQSSLESSERPRLILENATLGLLDYIERNTDGFRVLVRDAPSDRTAGSFSSVMGDVATSVEHIIAEQFKLVSPVRADARRPHRAGWPVVAGRSPHEEGRGRRPRRQPHLERPARPTPPPHAAGALRRGTLS